ncbi:hypothetical protein RB2654_14625 [Rhodobacterales bacterium HTCC2654]|uniref:Uncharacterized protein n=1 Tax=Maritimibacter alkaliphilus HTCC2654 TaxID=314271 RepID=A3VGX4_9RHOB|nr:hypothetical protein RB2654_14625 [Rhodobacterales bacterium HTCC2654] [Maritimibacter alkaliphilus HTCC2654]
MSWFLESQLSRSSMVSNALGSVVMGTSGASLRPAIGHGEDRIARGCAPERFG